MPKTARCSRFSLAVGMLWQGGFDTRNCGFEQCHHEYQLARPCPPRLYDVWDRKRAVAPNVQVKRPFRRSLHREGLCFDALSARPEPSWPPISEFKIPPDVSQRLPGSQSTICDGRKASKTILRVILIPNLALRGSQVDGPRGFSCQ